MTVEVALDEAASTAEAADLGGFTTATVTFPAGSVSGATESVGVSVTTDANTTTVSSMSPTNTMRNSR